jgi:hypothetical protein
MCLWKFPDDVSKEPQYVTKNKRAIGTLNIYLDGFHLTIFAVNFIVIKPLWASKFFVHFLWVFTEFLAYNILLKPISSNIIEVLLLLLPDTLLYFAEYINLYTLYNFIFSFAPRFSNV